MVKNAFVGFDAPKIKTYLISYRNGGGYIKFKGTSCLPLNRNFFRFVKDNIIIVNFFKEDVPVMHNA